MSLSSITVSGTLKKDPEQRFTPTNNIPVTNLLLEVCYIPRGTQNPDPIASQVIRVNAWRDLAEECVKNLKTGDKLLVIGRAQMNAYVNNDGKKKKEIEIDATSVVYMNDLLSIKLPPKSEEKELVNKQQFKKTTQEVEQVSNSDEVITNTEEIPF